MPLAAGTRLGAFEILALLGKGGMGEVYRARDPKLGRDVALKIIPSELAADPERLARFRREAHLLASLNHQNVASIYGLEEADGKPFLVLELADGEDLSHRLTRGAIPVEESLEIARQIAEALEEAHEHGIVHRDLKPANIKLTLDGKVKVLDFGLAKAYGGDTAEESSSDSQSPTMSAQATKAGLILGTAAYMSPEQARGKPVDKRADIWAFGVVLFEMLTGKRLFTGGTVSDTLASILKEEPDWTLLPVDTPRKLGDLLHRCLRKEVRNRLHDIGDARIEIEELENRGPEADESPAEITHRASWRPWLPWSVASVMALLAVFALGRSDPAAVLTPSTTRFTIPAAIRDGVTMAFSADGSRLAYSGQGADGVWRLYVREMSSFESKPIPGTEGASLPFFSPDGQWIGFHSSDYELMKVSLGGGLPFSLGLTQGTRSGASWGSDGSIVVQRAFGTGLVLIPAEGGGEPLPLTRIDPTRGERHHRFPVFLPGAREVLFTILSGISGEKHHVAVISLDDGETKVLTTGIDAHYVSTGHLIFMRGETLMAAPFDPDRLELTDAATVVLGSVANSGLRGGKGAYSVSLNGSIAYVAEAARTERELVWVDRDGNAELITEQRHRFFMPRLSPDGRQLVVSILEDDRFGVWTYSLERDTLTRITREGSSGYGLWSSNGAALSFTSDRAGPINVFRQPTAAPGAVELLASHDNTTLLGSWSPDGQELLVTIISPDTLGDIAVITPGSGDDPRALIETPNDEYSPEFSPDGKWIAYASDESGGLGVYVQSYPGLETKELVGTSSGADGEPKWSPDGRELFYRDGTRMMAVSVDLGPEISMGRPRVLFDGPYDGDLEGITGYDISADGSRFLMVRPTTEATALEPKGIHVVLNWVDELKAKMTEAGQ